MRWLATAGVLIALAASGCGGGGQLATPVAGIPNARGMQPSAVFFVNNGALWPSARWGFDGQPPLRRLLRVLMHGPTPAERAAGVTSLIPPGTHIVGLRLGDLGVNPPNRTLVNLSSQFAEGGSQRIMQMRVAQLVYTLEISSADSGDIGIQIDGKPQTISTPDGGFKQWVTRYDFATLMPGGWVPAYPPIGGHVSGKLQVFGFQGKGPLRQHASDVVGTVRLVDLHGRVLASQFAGGGGSVGTCCGGGTLVVPRVTRPTRALFQVIMAPSWWPAHHRLLASYPVWMMPVGRHG